MIVIENQIVANSSRAGGAEMDFAAIIDGVESFAAYVGELASVIGHVGRVAPLHDYCAACWRAKDGVVSNRWRR